MSKSLLGFGIIVLIALYSFVDSIAGSDAQAASTLTAAAGFLGLQTMLLMMDR